MKRGLFVFLCLLGLASLAVCVFVAETQQQAAGFIAVGLACVLPAAMATDGQWSFGQVSGDDDVVAGEDLRWDIPAYVRRWDIPAYKRRHLTRRPLIDNGAVAVIKRVVAHQEVTVKVVVPAHAGVHV